MEKGVYQLVAELTGGEETASSVDSLEVEFQTPAGIKAIMFEHATINEDSHVIVENEELKDLFIAIVGVHNYTAKASAQEVQGRSHGPDILTCNCVGACNDPMTADPARSTCTLILENATTPMPTTHMEHAVVVPAINMTTPMPMAHMEHAVRVPTINMTRFSINVAPLHLHDKCEPNATDHGHDCPPGTQCMPMASHARGLRGSIGHIERHACQLPLMQATAQNGDSAMYQPKSAFITLYYVCGSMAMLFLLSMAIGTYIITGSHYKTIDDGQDDSDEEFVA